MGEKEIKRAEFSGQWVVDEREEGMKKMPSKRAISRKRGGGGGGATHAEEKKESFATVTQSENTENNSAKRKE